MTVPQPDAAALAAASGHTQDDARRIIAALRDAGWAVVRIAETPQVQPERQISAWRRRLT